MPRETISDSTTPMFRVETAWGRDGGYVQVATTCTERRYLLERIVNEWLRHAGMPEIDVAELERKLADQGGITFDGWHFTATERNQVNELIRHLRRARDHAFGRDE